MRRSFWIGLLVVVLAGFAGMQQYSSWSLGKPQGKTTDKPEDGAANSTGGRAQGRSGAQGRGGGTREAVPVLVATAVQKAIPLQIRAVGNVESISTVSIKSQVTGIIQKAHFKEGDNVKKEQLLFTIDPRPLEA